MSSSARASTYSARTWVASLMPASLSEKACPSLRSSRRTLSVVITAVSTFFSAMSFSAWAVVIVA